MSDMHLIKDPDRWTNVIAFCNSREYFEILIVWELGQ